MDSNKCTTYVGHLYSESDNRMDMFDSMRATMDVPKTYKHMGWRLSTARRTDPVHRLLTTQDLNSAFKAARTEQNSGRKKKKVVIEIVNTVSVLHSLESAQYDDNLQMPGMKGPGKSKKPHADSDVEQNLTDTVASRVVLLPYTKELENVKNRLRCSEHRLVGENTFCWVDVSQQNTPHYSLCIRDLQEWAKYLVRTSAFGPSSTLYDV